MSWRIPAFPAEARERPVVRTVRDATLTPVGQGDLRTLQGPDRFVVGAVHDAHGVLVPTSQRLGGYGEDRALAADPGTVPREETGRRLAGRWLYGGHWTQGLSRFVLETLTTLWPRVPDCDGLVFHAAGPAPARVEGWMLALLEQAGLADLPVVVVDGSAGLRVERLVVPSRAFVVDGWAHAEARQVWDRVAEPVRGRGGSRQVYLSRTAGAVDLEGRDLASARTRDRALDRLFADLGFEVVDLSTLDELDRVRVVADAEVVAGSSGPALSLTALAPSGIRVVEIGTARNLHAASPAQRVIGSISGHRHLFVPGGLPTRSVAIIVRDALRTDTRRRAPRRARAAG